MRMLPKDKGRQHAAKCRRATEREVEKQWFPEFVSAVELARRQTHRGSG